MIDDVAVAVAGLADKLRCNPLAHVRQHRIRAGHVDQPDRDRAERERESRIRALKVGGDTHRPRRRDRRIDAGIRLEKLDRRNVPRLADCLPHRDRAVILEVGVLWHVAAEAGSRVDNDGRRRRSVFQRRQVVEDFEG